MVHQHVLPPLREEFRNHKMIPFVLPLVLLIAEDCTLTEYSDLILPVLTPTMKIQDPIQVHIYTGAFIVQLCKFFYTCIMHVCW